MNSFSKRQTQIMKGLAVLMLLVNHGLEEFPIDKLGAWSFAAGNLISLSKLCVSIFALLSGYGMFRSYEEKKKKNKEESMWRFVFGHILKLYAVFWLASIVSIMVVDVLWGNMGEIYEGHTAYYLMLDVMGISYITKSLKFVNSWWYVSVTLVYYALFPLIYYGIKKVRKGNYILMALFTVLSLASGGIKSAVVYGTFFYYGMVLAQENILDRFLNLFAEDKIRRRLKLLGSAGAFAVLCLLRQIFLKDTKMEYYLDWLLALVLILLVGGLTRGIDGKRKGVLSLIGDYSFEIYLLHAVFLKYFTKIVFVSIDVFSILVRLFLVSLAAAVVLKKLEQLLQLWRIPAWCRDKRNQGVPRLAGVLAGFLILLFTPEVIANMGIGPLVFRHEEYVMDVDAWEVPLFKETPLFWDFANKTYSSDEWDMVSFVDGILYTHYEGQTTVHVKLPFGKTVSCKVTVQEGAQEK